MGGGFGSGSWPPSPNKVIRNPSEVEELVILCSIWNDLYWNDDAKQSAKQWPSERISQLVQKLKMPVMLGARDCVIMLGRVGM